MLAMRPLHLTQSTELADSLIGESWPFHAGPSLGAPDVAERVAANFYTGPYVETWWIDHSERSVREPGVGLIRLYDLDDDTAMFDLRFRERHRGRGFGAEAVRWLDRHLFTTRSCARIEATTRQDNVAMRRTLVRCGYVKESHYRAGWPGPAGGPSHDAVGYARLRSDWEGGTVTPVDWNDEPAT
ncbi:RimJ/RimL family protein N-acetyltransferase [Nakamurella sp. UYEF19]|uniref:GNAT family N-acetyltransferase n=1 Tax=Nakamurella sp. UYEF19 TaxID=1756392 RepID=UPI003398C243